MKTFEISFHAQCFVRTEVEAETAQEAEAKARALSKADLCADVESHTIELGATEEITELVFEGEPGYEALLAAQEKDQFS